MAGTVMHLVIADMLLDKLNIENASLFFNGNLAPDAIMNRQDYVREMKRHTHFKDGLRQYEFRIEKNQEEYRVKLLNFYKEFYHEDSFYREFYLGYLVHILVDELFLLDYYEEFLVLLEKGKKSLTDEKFAKDFVFDVDQVDWELARTYQFRYEMPGILYKENNYEIPGWINNQELIASKNYVINRNFLEEHELLPLKVTTMERNVEFIQSCVEKIPGMLKERFGISNI